MTTPHPVSLAPAQQIVLGIPLWTVHLVLLLAGLASFALILRRRIAGLRAGAPDPRLDRIGERLRRALVVGVLQSRQPRYPVAGVLHILIFAGFVVLSVRSLALLAEGFAAGATELPGAVYGTVKDWTALVVLLCCAVAAGRRRFCRPARYHDRHARTPHGAEAYLILGLISLLMLADAAYEGAAPLHPGAGRPLASAAAALLAPLPGAALGAVRVAAFFLHNAALLFFLCYLPVSKHFHVLTAIPNVFLGKLPPAGRVKPARHGVTDLDSLPRIGAGRLSDFTWKHLLDFYSCTDCGRCSDHCPAYATGTALSPRMISVKCRDLAYSARPALRAPRGDADPPLFPDTISGDEVWACTTCGACEEACPVLIEYVDKIVDLRRHLVEEGAVPATVQKALAEIEKRGNPYGKAPRSRGDWIRTPAGAAPGLRVVKEGEAADLLLFADSALSYDPRIAEVGRAFGTILAAAGFSAGILGPDETDSGHEARRFGEEGLFEALRDANREALEARQVGRIVTADPHAMNALRHDYGLAVPVRHHSEVLADLLAAGRLPLAPSIDRRVHVFHDPCYLGRMSGVYDAPRRVLAALGLATAEMRRAKNRSFCCGGGSLYLFHEVEAERRMGEVRLGMAEEAGAQVLVTACPFCLIHLTDAVKTSGREGKIEVLDLAEVAARSLAPAARPAP